MYAILITLHSFIRWLVLLSLLYAIVRGHTGLRSGRVFTRADERARQWAVSIVHLQFMVGLGLYLVSPIVRYFLKNFSQAVHLREIRFFGMEHVCVMLIAVSVITAGAGKVKRFNTDAEKFRTMRKWFLWGLILILTSIPWTFSPLVSRPWIRFF